MLTVRAQGSQPWKSGSRGSNSTANVEFSDGWMDGRRGPEGSGAKEGFDGANSSCRRTPGTSRDRDVPAGSAPAARRDKGKVWEMLQGGEFLENSIFPPEFPSTAAAAGSDVEGKDRNKEKGESVMVRAPGTPRDGSSLERPLPPGEKGTGIK